jgi:hypothetical protein
MAKPSPFRLRWKGTISGPFTLGKISEMLRSGEISLIHNIEVDGSWITLRQYFRMIGNGTAYPITGSSSHSSNSETNIPQGLPLGASPQKNRLTRDQEIDHAVRLGYLWCGSTFLLPLLFAAIVPLCNVLMRDKLPDSSAFVLLAFATLAGCGLPLYFVRQIAVTLKREGLAEISQSQEKLCLALATLGVLVYLTVFWILTHSPR